MQREVHFARGLLRRDCKTWLPDGTLLEHAVYRQGKLQGVMQRFHPNSRLAERQVFNAGKPVEPAERYASDGRPLGADGKPVPRWKQWWWAMFGPPARRRVRVGEARCAAKCPMKYAATQGRPRAISAC